MTLDRRRITVCMIFLILQYSHWVLATAHSAETQRIIT